MKKRILAVIMVMILVLMPMTVFAEEGETPHAHNWKYSGSGDTITRVCQDTECNETNTVNIIAYSQSQRDGAAPLAASLQFGEGWTFEEKDSFNVTYVKIADGIETTLEDAPSEVGQYKAVMEYEGAQASMEYGIHEAIIEAEPKADECMKPHFECTCCGKCFVIGDPTAEVMYFVERNHADMVISDTHTFGEWQTVTESTCEEEGTLVRKCELCGYEETGILAKDAHVLDENGICTECGGDFSEPEAVDTNPETGDAFNMTIWLALMAMAAMAAGGAVITRKCVK